MWFRRLSSRWQSWFSWVQKRRPSSVQGLDLSLFLQRGRPMDGTRGGVFSSPIGRRGVSCSCAFLSSVTSLGEGPSESVGVSVPRRPMTGIGGGRSFLVPSCSEKLFPVQLCCRRGQVKQQSESGAWYLNSLAYVLCTLLYSYR